MPRALSGTSLPAAEEADTAGSAQSFKGIALRSIENCGDELCGRTGVGVAASYPRIGRTEYSSTTEAPKAGLTKDPAATGTGARHQRRGDSVAGIGRWMGDGERRSAVPACVVSSVAVDACDCLHSVCVERRNGICAATCEPGRTCSTDSAAGTEYTTTAGGLAASRAGRNGGEDVAAAGRRDAYTGGMAGTAC